MWEGINLPVPTVTTHVCTLGTIGPQLKEGVVAWLYGFNYSQPNKWWTIQPVSQNGKGIVPEILLISIYIRLLIKDSQVL